MANDRWFAGELKLMPAMPERLVIEKILKHLGLEPQPPPSAPDAWKLSDAVIEELRAKRYPALLMSRDGKRPQ